MTKYVFKSAAARYFFRNGCAELSTGGLTFHPYANPSCPNKGPGDIVIDRDYVDVDFVESDFYKFLWRTCSSRNSFAKKALAIGYMLCNKLPRDRRCRCKTFICVNENDGAYANGKTLFTESVAQFCNTVRLQGENCQSSFWLAPVSESTNLVVIDDVPQEYNYAPLVALCTEDWQIDRKCRRPLYLAHETAPYVLLSANITSKSLRKDGGFRRRFVTLDFSSFFGQDNPISKYLERNMFRDWGEDQWHMFDNFMLDCIMQYLYCSNGGEEDIFSLY